MYGWRNQYSEESEQIANEMWERLGIEPTTEQLIEIINEARQRIPDYPWFFLRIAEVLPPDFPNEVAAGVLELMPNSDDNLTSDDGKDAVFIEPAIKALAKINPEGYIEYLIELASVLSFSKYGCEQVITIEECIREVVSNTMKREWLLQQLKIMYERHGYSSVADHVRFIKQTLSEEDFTRESKLLMRKRDNVRIPLRPPTDNEYIHSEIKIKTLTRYGKMSIDERMTTLRRIGWPFKMIRTESTWKGEKKLYWKDEGENLWVYKDKFYTYPEIILAEGTIRFQEIQEAHSSQKLEEKDVVQVLGNSYRYDMICYAFALFDSEELFAKVIASSIDETMAGAIIISKEGISVTFYPKIKFHRR